MLKLPPVHSHDPADPAAPLPPEVLRLIYAEVEGESYTSPVLLLRLQYEPDDAVGDRGRRNQITFALSVPAAHRIARELDNAVRNYIGISDDEELP